MKAPARRRVVVAPHRLRLAASLLAACGGLAAYGVEPPPSASQPWTSDETSSYPRAQAPLAPALPPRPLTLGDLIDLTLRADPDTSHSWQVAVQAASTLAQARGAFLPQVAGSLGYGKQYQKTDGNLVAGPITVPELQIQNSPGIFVSPGANLSWTLWDFGMSKAGYDAAKAGLIAANFQHNATLQGVVRQVQESYFKFDEARGALAAADAGVDVAEGTLNEAMLKRRSGLAGVSDELQARQGEAQAQLQREQARLAYDQARAQLLELAGIPPSPTIEIASQPPGSEPAPAIAEVNSLVNQALATRPDLAARYAKIASLEADLRRTERSFLPTVGFNASVSRLRGEQATTTSQGVANPTAIQQAQISQYDAIGYVETAQAGISINANFTNWFVFHQAVAEKRAEIDAAKADLQNALVTAEHDVWLAVDSCQSARTAYEQAKTLLDLADRAYRATEQARASGLQSTTDLLESQQALARARYDLVRARSRLFTSAADLAYATGQTAMSGDTP